MANSKLAESREGLTTQLRIELDGSLAGSVANGLGIEGSAADVSAIRGLAVNRFANRGILTNGADNVRVDGNFIGTDVSGTVALGGQTIGVLLIGGERNVIGGLAPEARNLISGQTSGLQLSSSGSDNFVEGNLIGTDRFGVRDLGNVSVGIWIDGPQGTVLGGTDVNARNVISANGNGIEIDSGSNTLIQNNWIGTDVTGTQPLGNTQGIFDESRNAAGQGTQIGTPGAGNVISANTYGILLTNRSSDAQSVVAQGNFIGTDHTGTVAVGNTVGIQIGAGGSSSTGSGANTFGGSGAGEGNVVSGNSTGISIQHVRSTGNTFIGNLIGVGVDEVTPLGNTGDGIHIHTSVTGNQYGGTASGERNIIAHNGGAGIRLRSGARGGNTIRGNSIHSNTGLGIDLDKGTQDANNVTANDAGDADTGPNDLQNYPVLTAASRGVSDTTIEGTLNSTPDTTLTIDFYSNSTADPSGFGEGETYLGSTTVRTDAAGDVSFSATVSDVVPAGHFVTATATNPAGSTSEFSGERSATGGVTPLTADIVDVSPDPIDGAAPPITVSFNRPVTGLDVADFSLTRDGVPGRLVEFDRPNARFARADQRQRIPARPRPDDGGTR